MHDHGIQCCTAGVATHLSSKRQVGGYHCTRGTGVGPLLWHPGQARRTSWGRSCRLAWSVLQSLSWTWRSQGGTCWRSTDRRLPSRRVRLRGGMPLQPRRDAPHTHTQLVAHSPCKERRRLLSRAMSFGRSVLSWGQKSSSVSRHRPGSIRFVTF